MRKFYYSIFLFAASLPCFAESKAFDYSKSIDNYYTFRIQASKTFTVTKVDSALIAYKNPMSISITCRGVELARISRSYDQSQLNIEQTISVSTEVTAGTCATKNVEISFENPGLLVQELPIFPSITKERLSNEGFVRLYNDSKEDYAINLVSYGSSLSDYGASQNTMYCIIQTYKNRPGMGGIIKDLMTNYYNTFGRHYEEDNLPCPPVDNLATRLQECKDNPKLKTLFCNTAYLYNQTKAWFWDFFINAKARKAQIASDSSEIAVKLKSVVDDVSREVGTSESILGLETDFEE